MLEHACVYCTEFQFASTILAQPRTGHAPCTSIGAHSCSFCNPAQGTNASIRSRHPFIPKAGCMLQHKMLVLITCSKLSVHKTCCAEKFAHPVQQHNRVTRDLESTVPRFVLSFMSIDPCCLVPTHISLEVLPSCFACLFNTLACGAHNVCALCATQHYRSVMSVLYISA